MELALLYNLSGTEKGKKIRRLLFRSGIGIRDVKPEEYSRSIGFLTVGPAYREAKSSEPSIVFMDEMIVFSGIPDELLDSVLTEMRRERLIVGLKAVATEHNMEWSSVRLHDELVREREYMARNYGSGPLHG